MTDAPLSIKWFETVQIVSVIVGLINGFAVIHDDMLRSVISAVIVLGLTLSCVSWPQELAALGVSRNVGPRRHLDGLECADSSRVWLFPRRYRYRGKSNERRCRRSVVHAGLGEMGPTVALARVGLLSTQSGHQPLQTF
jgi:hypothetical protein